MPDKIEVDTQQAMAVAGRAAKAAAMEHAKALYDFPGQQAGDLKFKQGDTIEIVSKGVATFFPAVLLPLRSS